MKKSILTIDIETFANVSRTWGGGLYEQDVIEVVKEWEIASFAYKWFGKAGIHCVDRANQKSDKKLMVELKKVLEKADILVVQNGKAFDIRSWNARMTHHGIVPPTVPEIIDIKVEAKKRLRLNSYSLDNLAKFFGIKGKLKHRGFDMWKGCEKNDPKAWSEMRRYNKHDVKVTEQVYRKLRPIMASHPNVNQPLPGRPPEGCPKCGSQRLVSHSIQLGYRRYECRACGGYCRSRLKIPGYSLPKVK